MDIKVKASDLKKIRDDALFLYKDLSHKTMSPDEFLGKCMLIAVLRFLSTNGEEYTVVEVDERKFK